MLLSLLYMCKLNSGFTVTVVGGGVDSNLVVVAVLVSQNISNDKLNIYNEASVWGKVSARLWQKIETKTFTTEKAAKTVTTDDMCNICRTDTQNK